MFIRSGIVDNNGGAPIVKNSKPQGKKVYEQFSRKVKFFNNSQKNFLILES